MGEPPSKEELDRVTAEWRADLARRGHSVDAPVVKKSASAAEVKARESVLIKTLTTLTRVVDTLERQIGELQGRIATLRRSQV